MWRFKERTRKDMNIIAKYAKEEGKREAARNMKKEGLRMELIARCTTLPLEDIAVL
jgi:predicted transposase YdaD